MSKDSHSFHTDEEDTKDINFFTDDVLIITSSSIMDHMSTFFDVKNTKGLRVCKYWSLKCAKYGKHHEPISTYPIFIVTTIDLIRRVLPICYLFQSSRVGIDSNNLRQDAAPHWFFQSEDMYVNDIFEKEERMKETENKDSKQVVPAVVVPKEETKVVYFPNIKPCSFLNCPKSMIIQNRWGYCEYHYKSRPCATPQCNGYAIIESLRCSSHYISSCEHQYGCVYGYFTDLEASRKCSFHRS